MIGPFVRGEHDSQRGRGEPQEFWPRQGAGSRERRAESREERETALCNHLGKLPRL